MDLESQVLKFLQKEPNKHFAIVEIVSGTYRVKPSQKLLTKNHSRIWQVTGALNKLIEKGMVEGMILELMLKEAGEIFQGKFVDYPRYVVLYQAKKT
jgi:hypothetical protein